MLRKCPLCGVSVKIENLERHVASVHPKQRSSIVLSEVERKVITQAAKKRRAPIRVRGSTLAVLAVVALAVAALVVALPYVQIPRGGQIIRHWHTDLSITVDGQQVTIPANIGIDSDLWMDHTLDSYGMQSMPSMGMMAMAPLHTHNPDGKVHQESSVVRDYTIGEFFRIWGKSYDAQQVLGHPAGPGHQVWMMVDGNRIAPSYSPALLDGMQIELVCGIP